MTTMPSKRGPKPKDPAGEPMKPRKIRATDEQWAGAKFIGDDKTRAFWAAGAKKMRKAAK